MENFGFKRILLNVMTVNFVVKTVLNVLKCLVANV